MKLKKDIELIAFKMKDLNVTGYTRYMDEVKHRASLYKPMCKQSPFNLVEWEIINHRLEVPDALCEALTDTYWDEECGINYSEMYDLMDSALAEMLDYENLKNLDDMNCFERLILRECIEGSTYIVSEYFEQEIVEEYDKKTLKLIRKSMLTIENKTGYYFPTIT